MLPLFAKIFKEAFVPVLFSHHVMPCQLLVSSCKFSENFCTNGWFLPETFGRIHKEMSSGPWFFVCVCKKVYTKNSTSSADTGLSGLSFSLFAWGLVVCVFQRPSKLSDLLAELLLVFLIILLISVKSIVMSPVLFLTLIICIFFPWSFCLAGISILLISLKNNF